MCGRRGGEEEGRECTNGLPRADSTVRTLDANRRSHRRVEGGSCSDGTTLLPSTAGNTQARGVDAFTLVMYVVKMRSMACTTQAWEVCGGDVNAKVAKGKREPA